MLAGGVVVVLLWLCVDAGGREGDEEGGGGESGRRLLVLAHADELRSQPRGTSSRPKSYIHRHDYHLLVHHVNILALLCVGV